MLSLFFFTFVFFSVDFIEIILCTSILDNFSDNFSDNFMPRGLGSVVIVHLYSVCGLKAAAINVPCSLIQELKLYKFEQNQSVAEATKNIFYVKDEVGWLDFMAYQPL